MNHEYECREDNLCALVTLLARFRSEKGNPSEPAQWKLDISPSNNVEQPQSLTSKAQFLQLLEYSFLQKSRDRIQRELQTFQVKMTERGEGDHTLMVSLVQCQDDNKVLSNSDVQSVLKKISEEIESNIVFDYAGQVKQVLKAGTDVLLTLCPYLDASELQQIQIDPIVVSGLEDLVPYEIDFMGSARMIIYPDANLFSNDHLEYIRKKTCDNELWCGASIRTKTLVSYRYECLFNILHEMVHCVQTSLKQSDSTAWILEHDACRLALCLMNAISQKKEVRNLFPPGKEEEAILYVSDLVDAAHRVGVSKEQNEGYLQWRESFGLVPPVPGDAFDFANDNIAVADYFKYRVGLEAYFLLQKQNKCTETLIHTCFKNRTGNLADQQLLVPREVHISEAENLFI